MENQTTIYIEYYSHENCDCYKIDNPWGKYRKDIKVLCKVSEGYEYAKILAIGIINQCLTEALKSIPLQKKED